MKITAQKLTVLFIIIFWNHLFSQKKEILGLVVDSDVIPIEYVNVGVLNRFIGTVTDSVGNFSLIVKESMLKDTLRISCLGFETKNMIIDELLNNNTIILSRTSIILDEVVVRSKNRKKYIKGKKREKTKSAVFFTRPEMKIFNLGSEIGRKFALNNEKKSYLQNFRFYVKQNNFSKIKFRINIYSLNDNNPDKKINTKNIYVELKDKKKGWVNVDLIPYDIVTDKDVVISVEWVEASKDGDRLSLPLSVPSFGSSHYYKFSSQNIWKKYKMISTSMILEFNR